MKTTIIIEDGSATPGAAVSDVALSSSEPRGEPPSVDAGAAPDAVGSASAPAGGIDGGVPPAWLIDALAAEGAMQAPSSPEGIDVADLDAGGAAS